jgi:predicted protein tyrosine phosphatase
MPNLLSVSFQWVTPRLAMGGALSPEELPRLVGVHGVTHVVDLRSEGRDDEALLAVHGVKLLHLPTADGTAVPQKLLDEGVAWVQGALSEGARVLVHCEHGIGRSALLVLCVLVAEGCAPLEAMVRAKRVRPEVAPNTEQLSAFITWCERRGPSVAPSPSLEALERIAWALPGSAREL